MHLTKSTRQIFVVLFSIGAAACGGGGSGGATDNGRDGGASGPDGGGTDPTPNPMCEATSFSAVASHSLPTGNFPMPSDADHCSYTGNRSDRTYSLTDINGDNLPDLVLTGDCTDGGDKSLGNSHWDVYENQGGSFAGAATSYSLPAGGFPMPSDAGHCSYTGNRSDRTYSLTDIDGDKLPDLVLTGDCTNGGDESLGNSHWNVYKNQGNGFSQTATRYELPLGSFPMPSDAGHCSYTGNRSDRTYSLTDIDGDHLPDLVLAADCTDGGDASLGNSHWNVYKNQGDAFAQSATTYALPSGGFPMPSDADHCSYTGNRSDRTYSLTDVDGDDLPDLVLTADCTDGGDASLGDSHWNVYKNQGGAFSQAATVLGIPAGGFPMSSDAGHCSYTGNRSDRTYAFTDINGDDLPDIILTGDCTDGGDEAIGNARWDVHPLACDE